MTKTLREKQIVGESIITENDLLHQLVLKRQMNLKVSLEQQPDSM